MLDSFLKLHPRKMMGNPVMFVVEIGSVVTTVLLFRGGPAFGFNLQITLWLWFTVLFANFAEAMAEGRGKAQADTLRKARAETDRQPPAPGGQHRAGVQFASCAPTTLSSSRQASSFPPTARSSKALLRSMSRPSPASRLP